MPPYPTRPGACLCRGAAKGPQWLINGPRPVYPLSVRSLGRRSARRPPPLEFSDQVAGEAPFHGEAAVADREQKPSDGFPTFGHRIGDFRKAFQWLLFPL